MARRRVGVGSLLGLLAILFFSIVLFQRMWTFHTALSIAQGNAAHLEKLYENSLDEAADWRNKLDVDMKQAMEEAEKKTKIIQGLEAKMESMQKTNRELERKISVLSGELLEEKKKCEKSNQVDEA